MFSTFFKEISKKSINFASRFLIERILINILQNSMNWIDKAFCGCAHQSRTVFTDNSSVDKPHK
jgi:hypothetical protein